MQSAEATTPAPTYGTPASSSRPWTVPSSPNGPCRTGRTTSTAAERLGGLRVGERPAASPRRAVRQVSATVCCSAPRAPSGRRGRSRSSSPRSAPGRAPRAPSGPTRARSRARSSGRPRARRRGAGSASRRRRGRRRWLGRRRSKRPTTITTVVPGSAPCRPRILREDDARRARSVASPRPTCDVEARASQLRARVGVGLARDVGDLRGLRALRDLERDHRALALLRAGGRILADDDAGRGVVLDVVPRDREAGPGAATRRDSYALPMTFGTVIGFGPFETLIADGRALDQLRARPSGPARSPVRPAPAS